MSQLSRPFAVLGGRGGPCWKCGATDTGPTRLAFVLCHELSHTIYGHTLKQTQNKAWLAGVQVT